MVRKAKMILQIGNKKSFTFVELMVTVAILSSGLVLLYGSFFTCLNGFSYYLNRLYVQQWSAEKIWEVQDGLIRSKQIANLQQKGIFLKKGKKFFWEARIKLINATQDLYLYRLNLKVFWQESAKRVSMSDVIYIQN